MAIITVAKKLKGKNKKSGKIGILEFLTYRPTEYMQIHACLCTGVKCDNSGAEIFQGFYLFQKYAGSTMRRSKLSLGKNRDGRSSDDGGNPSNTIVEFFKNSVTPKVSVLLLKRYFRNQAFISIALIFL